MLDYNKAEVVAWAESLNNLIEATTGDGVGLDDLDELIDTFTKGTKVINEMQAVPAGVGLHVVAVIADKQGDKLVAKAVDADPGSP
jgi:K+-sensing histidine kinase KdpD